MKNRFMLVLVSVSLLGGSMAVAACYCARGGGVHLGGGCQHHFFVRAGVCLSDTVYQGRCDNAYGAYGWTECKANGGGGKTTVDLNMYANRQGGLSCTTDDDCQRTETTTTGTYTTATSGGTQCNHLDCPKYEGPI